MQITLHVGTEKTGTTSIQQFMASHREALSQSGWLYPACFGEGPHLKVTGACLDFKPNHAVLAMLGLDTESSLTKHRLEMHKAFRLESEHLHCEHAIISDEHINVHLNTVEQLKRLKFFFEGVGEISEVMIYFRRQDEFLSSMVSEAVKARAFGAYNFPEPIHTFHAVPYRFNYQAIVRNLRSAFPGARIDVRGYPSGLDFDVVRDFTRGRFASAMLDYHGASRKNLALPGRTLSALTLLGVVASDLNENAVLANWNVIVAAASEAFPGPPFRFDASTAAEFLRRFDKANKVLSEEFSSLAGALLNEPADQNAPLVDEVEPGALLDRIAASLPDAAAEGLERTLGELKRRGGRYEGAFPAEVLARWASIKQRNLAADWGHPNST